MKILGISGSPRINGNSDILLTEALNSAQKNGAETEKIILDKLNIAGCRDCRGCNENGVCVIKDDMETLRDKILEADAVIHSTPVYFWTMTSQMKAYLDRWCVFFNAEWRWHSFYKDKMKGKSVGLITVCGDSNVHTADPVVHSFRSTAEMTGLKWHEPVMESANDKGEIASCNPALLHASELGRSIASYIRERSD